MLNPCRPSAPSGSRCSSRLGHPQNCDGLPPATPARAPHWPGGRASHTSPLCILLGDSASRNRHTNDRRRLAARPHALWVVSPFTVARPMTLGRRLESVDCRAGDCKAGHSPRRPLAIGTGGHSAGFGCLRSTSGGALRGSLPGSIYPTAAPPEAPQYTTAFILPIWPVRHRRSSKWLVPSVASTTTPPPPV